MGVRDVVDASVQAGFSGESLVTFMAIVGCESNYDARATNDTRDAPSLPAGVVPEYSVGAYQINLLAHPDISEQDARNYLIGARYSYTLSQQGRDFSAWTCYTSGAYAAYLDRARAAIVAWGTPPVVSTVVPAPDIPRFDGLDGLFAAWALLTGWITSGLPAYWEQLRAFGAQYAAPAAGQVEALAAYTLRVAPVSVQQGEQPPAKGFVGPGGVLAFGVVLGPGDLTGAGARLPAWIRADPQALAQANLTSGGAFWTPEPGAPTYVLSPGMQRGRPLPYGATAGAGSARLPGQGPTQAALVAAAQALGL